MKTSIDSWRPFVADTAAPILSNLRPRTMKIHFITTGGTIDKVFLDAEGEYAIGSPEVAEIMKDTSATFDFEIESVMAKDSLEMTDADRQLVRDRVVACGCERVIITHGTDSMVDTARALLGVSGKIVVVTGAMKPARFRDSDAVFNIGVAVGAVLSLPPGVYLAMGGRVLDPRKAYKNREKHRFEERS